MIDEYIVETTRTLHSVAKTADLKKRVVLRPDYGTSSLSIAAVN